MRAQNIVHSCCFPNEAPPVSGDWRGPSLQYSEQVRHVTSGISEKIWIYVWGRTGDHPPERQKGQRKLVPKLLKDQKGAPPTPTYDT